MTLYIGLPAPSPSKKPSAPSSLSTGAVKSSAMKATIPKSSSQPIPSFKSNNNRSRAGSLDKYGPSKATSQPTKFTKHTAADRDRERDRHAARPATSASGPTKKRPRSESRSESPPPKRRATSMEEEDLPGDLSSTIWSIFGRKRDRYVGMDVFSDDEDMEVDARVLEREEKFRSAIFICCETLSSDALIVLFLVPALRRRRIWRRLKKSDDMRRRNAGARRRRTVVNGEPRLFRTLDGFVSLNNSSSPTCTLSRDRTYQSGASMISFTIMHLTGTILLGRSVHNQCGPFYSPSLFPYLSSFLFPLQFDTPPRFPVHLFCTGFPPLPFIHYLMTD